MNRQIKVVVLSGIIHPDDVITALRDGSVVVLETTRTHAKEVETVVTHALEMGVYLDGKPDLIHLSAEVPNSGWSSFLLDREVLEYQPGITQAHVINAVRNWIDAGSPDKLA